MRNLIRLSILYLVYFVHLCKKINLFEFNSFIKVYIAQSLPALHKCFERVDLIENL